MDDGGWRAAIDAQGTWLCEHSDRAGNAAPPTRLKVAQAALENPNAAADRRRGRLWCPDCGTYWRVWEHQSTAKQYVTWPNAWWAPPEGYPSRAPYRRTRLRDIDRIVAAARELLPGLEVVQYQQSWPGDDDGLWFLTLPPRRNRTQIESPNGACPFTFEDDLGNLRTGNSVAEVVAKVLELLQM